MAAMNLQQLMAMSEPERKAWFATWRKDEPIGPPRHPDGTPVYPIGDRAAYAEEYYDALGALVKEHGICFPPMK